MSLLASEHSDGGGKDENDALVYSAHEAVIYKTMDIPPDLMLVLLDSHRIHLFPIALGLLL